MFGKLIPWKKKHEGNVKAWKEEDHPVALLRHDFDEMWNRFWDDWRSGLSLRDDTRWFGSQLAVDDKEKEYVVRAELPGFEPEDFELKVTGNVLTLRAEHKEDGKHENGGTYHRYGSFSETFTLPRGVLSDKIDARYHSGVLEVHLPKSEDCQAKRIEVTAA
jgi:HSP20 family protein